jgi:uncharacterized membrane protein YfcA
MDLSQYLPLAVLMVCSGLLAGVIAGMLGVGGGIILVPILEYALRYADVPAEWRMHVAVATSVATIIPTAMSSGRAHHARDSVDWPLVRAWAPGMVLGGALGSALASQVSLPVLTAVFGFAALTIAVKMLLPLESWHIRAAVPMGIGGKLIATLVASVSVMMGVGGGTIGVPVMNVLGHKMHKSVGTATVFGFLIAMPGTMVYMFARPAAALPLWTIGFVSLVGFLLIAPASVLTAPLGARIAHALSGRNLSRAFAVFLLIVATRMLYRTFAS